MDQAGSNGEAHRWRSTRMVWWATFAIAAAIGGCWVFVSPVGPTSTRTA